MKFYQNYSSPIHYSNLDSSLYFGIPPNSPAATGNSGILLDNSFETGGFPINDFNYLDSTIGAFITFDSNRTSILSKMVNLFNNSPIFNSSAVTNSYQQGNSNLINLERDTTFYSNTTGENFTGHYYCGEFRWREVILGDYYKDGKTYAVIALASDLRK